MRQKLCALALASLLINLLCCAPFVVAAKQKDAALPPDKVKAKIIKYGTGRDARVEVTLRDGTKLKGYVSAIETDRFVVADAKHGNTTNVAYDQVRELKRDLSLNSFQKAFAAVGLGIVAIALVAYAIHPD
jgi:hypothetical protein